MEDKVITLFSELLELKIPCAITNLEPTIITLQGFYKHGHIDITHDGSQFILRDRYSSQYYSDLDIVDIIQFNVLEWEIYKDRYTGWETIESPYNELVYSKQLPRAVGEWCEECNRFVPNFEYQMCCDGYQCGCLGLPIEPCFCSTKCSDKFRKENNYTW